MTKDEFREAVIKFAESLGMVKEAEKANAVIRNNLKVVGEDNVRYLGIIRAGEETSGRYSDLSLVFLPGKDDKMYNPQNETFRHSRTSRLFS